MLKSNPLVEQYIQVKFNDDDIPYLRYCDLTHAPNWNMIGILWYEMNQGSWEPVFTIQPYTLENKYQLCLKQ